MRVVFQRVKKASVTVDAKIVGEIGDGILLLVGFESSDNSEDYNFISEKVSGLRIFEDSDGKMNLSVNDIGGNVLVVPNFTLYGDARKGRRPSYSNSSNPSIAAKQFGEFCDKLSEYFPRLQKGVFQATMEVNLINDGPVTILLDSKKNF